MKFTSSLGLIVSGSMSGVTGSHNKGGQYFRQRSVPTNPNTARQQTVRSVFGAAVQSWSDSLSEPARESWRGYAEQVEVTDSLGLTKQLSGQQWYVGMATLIGQINAFDLLQSGNLPDFDSSAPAVANTGAPPGVVTTATLDATTPPGLLTLTGSMEDESPVAGTVILFIGPPVTPGTRFYKGPYQLATIDTIAQGVNQWTAVADMGDPEEWATDIVPTPATIGAFFPIRVRILYEDGRLSQEFRTLVQFEDVTP